MLQIIQNDPEVPPGNLADFLTIPHCVHHPWRDGILPAVTDISALIVLGGAMGADDDDRHPFLSGLKGLISQVVSAGIPYLGICLGGQLLASALGRPVVSNRWEELGSLRVSLTEEGERDLLFAGLPKELDTFQWHHDSFDLPAGAALLASSAACPHQAFRVGDCAWGLQFHPEVSVAIIRDWCAWDRDTAAEAERLVAAFSGIEHGYRVTARRLYGNFIGVIEKR